MKSQSERHRGFDDVSVEGMQQSKSATNGQSVEENAESAPGGAGEELSGLERRDTNSGLIDFLDPIGTESVTAFSVSFGLIGLAAALVVLGVIGGIGVFLWFETQAFGIMTPIEEVVVIQLIYFPSAAGESVLVFAVLLWSAPLLLRIIVASLLGSLGIGAFLATFHQLAGHPFNDVVHGFWECVFSFSACVAAFGIAVQLMSRWSLHHLSAGEEKGRRTSTRAMMEVTGLAALTYALIKLLDDQGVQLFNFGAAVLGFAFAACAIAACFGTLVRDMRITIRILWLVFLISLGWIGSCVLITAQMREQFGWKLSADDFIRIGGVALVGTTLVFVISTLGFVWLRFCGWKCSRD
jgi:hypothetical protein